MRDAQRWASYLDETIGLWGDKATVKFQSHHWPKWGNAEVLDYLQKQRDVYKYLHDQSVRLMNKGLTMHEIGNSIALLIATAGLVLAVAPLPAAGVVGTLATACLGLLIVWYWGRALRQQTRSPLLDMWYERDVAQRKLATGV